MKKMISMILAVLMIAVMFTGCGKTSNTETPGSEQPETDKSSAETNVTDEPQKEAPVLGITFRDTTNPTYIKEINAMQEKCDEYGMTMIVQDAHEDLATQISQIENFMAMNVDYIFVNVFDADGIKKTIEKAVNEGFFVIIYDATFDIASLTFGYIDNYEYGYNIGKMAAEFINSNEELKNAETVEWGLQTYTTVTDIIARGDGVKDALTELAPNAKLVIEQDVFSTEEGVTATENFLQAHPDIKIVCGVTDPFVYGAYQAFNAAGYTGDEYGVFGCDGTDQALELISKRSIYRGTVALPLEKGARDLIDALWKHSKGEEIDDKVPFELTCVTAENIDEYLTE